jgi:hypothetical protein
VDGQGYPPQALLFWEVLLVGVPHPTTTTSVFPAKSPEYQQATAIPAAEFAVNSLAGRNLKGNQWGN